MTNPDDATMPSTGVVRFERLLDAPVERVWGYLVEEELRKTWLGGGTIDLVPGGRVNIFYDHVNITDEPQLPTGTFEPHFEEGTVVAVDPPHLLSYTWGEWFGQSCVVSFELSPLGERTRLVLTHRRIAGVGLVYDVATGWHGHLDALEDKIRGGNGEYFWSNFDALHEKYQREWAAREGR